jgi:hypothetical protein
MITLGKYILDERGQPKPETDLLKWASWIQAADRQIALDTIVFGGVFDRAMKRCAGSREQAEAMHAEIVEKVKRAIPEKK